MCKRSRYMEDDFLSKPIFGKYLFNDWDSIINSHNKHYLKWMKFMQWFDSAITFFILLYPTLVKNLRMAKNYIYIYIFFLLFKCTVFLLLSSLFFLLYFQTILISFPFLSFPFLSFPLLFPKSFPTFFLQKIRASSCATAIINFLSSLHY